MNRLGRLFALPWLLIALATQSLAPVAAATMRPDPAAFGICSAHELGGGPHRPDRDPANSPGHDCCAFACALTGLAASPPPPSCLAPAALATTAQLAPAVRDDAASPSPLDRPRSRGPPSAALTS
jgi:hypothetical protein